MGPHFRNSRKTATLLAAAAALAAQHAQAVTLSLFYGQDPDYGNSNNSVMVSYDYNPNSTATDGVGQQQVFPAPELQSVSQTSPTTITVPVGGYLSIAIDAVLTGNVNPDGGKLTGTSRSQQVQPNYLGLAYLEIGVSSTDGNASYLTPITNDGPDNPFGFYNGRDTYRSTANINTQQGPNGGGYNVVPTWPGGVFSGDVIPTTGYPNYGNGNMGVTVPAYAADNFNISSNTAAGVSTLEAFAASNNVAAYSNATDFFDTLIFEGMNLGTATLTPWVATGKNGSMYWSLATPGTSTTASLYQPVTFGAADTVNAPQPLVIDVQQARLPIVSWAYYDEIKHGTVITSGPGDHQGTFSPDNGDSALDVSVSPENYQTLSIAEVTSINSNAGDSLGSIEVNTGQSVIGPTFFAVDIKVNGAQATTAQLQTLLVAINGLDGTQASDVIASLSDPTGGQAVAQLDDASTHYNMFFSFLDSGYYNYTLQLGINLTQFNDPALVGYTFSAVSIIPEPSSLLLLCGAGVLSMRRRRA